MVREREREREREIESHRLRMVNSLSLALGGSLGVLAVCQFYVNEPKHVNRIVGYRSCSLLLLGRCIARVNCR